MKLKLRDYQTECLIAISEASQADNISRPLVSLPTGSGNALSADILDRFGYPDVRKSVS